MRKVTETTVHAFLDRKPLVVGNTTSTGSDLLLHGNKIAWHGQLNGCAGVFLTFAGWPTATTQDRLDGVLRVMGHQSMLDQRRGLGVSRSRRYGCHLFECGAGAPRARLTEGRVDMGDDGIVFVAHPCTALGLRAVVVMAAKCGRTN